MEHYIAMFGAISTIFVVLVTVTMLVNFFVKGLYLYLYKLSLALHSGDKDAHLSLTELFAVCEEQKVWLSVVWQRPVSTLLALLVLALGFRLNLGMSVTFGLSSMTFLAFGLVLPRWIPVLPTYRVFSVAPAASQAPSATP